MKKILLVAGLLAFSYPVFSSELPQMDGSVVLAQYGNERVVTAYYVSGGQLVRIKIKLKGDVVVAYSSGKDMVGNEQWNFVANGYVRRTNSAYDGDLAREFDYTADLPINNGYQMTTLKVYF